MKITVAKKVNQKSLQFPVTIEHTRESQSSLLVCFLSPRRVPLLLPPAITTKWEVNNPNSKPCHRSTKVTPSFADSHSQFLTAYKVFGPRFASLCRLHQETTPSNPVKSAMTRISIESHPRLVARN